MKHSPRAAQAEQARIIATYQRRSQVIDSDLYAPWQPGEDLMRSERRRTAAQMLHRMGVFPKPETACLEVGCGKQGWFSELIGWGVRETNLHGIDIDADRLEIARLTLPAADLRIGDATELPWPTATFELVVVSTVLTSILEPSVRRAVAAEVSRVLRPGGALLWYDFATNHRNHDVRAISRNELLSLFPGLSGQVRRITLAPPIARFVAPISWQLATLLASIPVLRTHWLAVLVKTL